MKKLKKIKTKACYCDTCDTSEHLGTKSSLCEGCINKGDK